MVVQWLRFCTSIGGSTGSILGWGAKFPRAAIKMWYGQKKKKQTNKQNNNGKETGGHIRQKLGTRGSLGLEHLKHSEDPKGNCLQAKLAGKSVSWGQVTWAPSQSERRGWFHELCPEEKKQGRLKVWAKEDDWEPFSQALKEGDEKE